MERTVDFTRGAILKPLLLFALPVLFALFLQALYGAVDLLVVGRFAGPENVSGVAVGSQLMTTVTGLISSLAMGATIFLAQKLGQGDREKSGAIIGTSITLFALVGAVLTVALPLLSPVLARWMQAPPEAFFQTRRYIAVCGLGSVMIVAYNLIGSIFRGLGDARTPLLTVLIAAVCNIAGDLLLVAGLHLGAAGAAVATVLSQGVSVAVSLCIIRRRPLPFPVSKKQLRPEGAVIRRILAFGAPIALQDFLVGLSFLVILALVNTLGVTASAGVGVAEKVCAFIMLVPIAFMQSMSAYVAQNTGAGKPDRAVRGLVIAIGVSAAFGAAMFWLTFFHGDLLAGLFSGDPPVIEAGFSYLKAYAIDCLLTCFLFCFIGYYNGLGRTGFVMVQGVLSAFLIRIPVAWFMKRTVGTLFSIGLGIPCSTVVQILACAVFFWLLRAKAK